MTDVVVLPVPDALSALYLVPALIPAEEAERVVDAAVARHVAEPLRRLTRCLLGTAGLAVAVRQLADFAVLDPDAPASVGELSVVAFASRTVPWPGPVHEWVTRAGAAALAAELNLPLVDCFSKNMIEAGEALATLPGSADLTSVAGGFRLADWVEIEHIEACLITRGLRRFGLPELKVDQVPPDMYPLWSMMLVAIGARVHEQLRCYLRGGDPGSFVEIPAQFGVGHRDIGAAYGLGPQPDGQLLPVQLSMEPVVSGATLGSYLSVDSPAGLRSVDHRRALRTVLSGPGVAASGAARREQRNRRAAAARTRAEAAPSRPQT